MGALEFHRGVGFSVVPIGVGWWQWAIHPPASVKGFVFKHGQIFGDRSKAVEAAKRAIERQDAVTN